jgi:hypothetical protein
MSRAKVSRIIAAMRHERYRFAPVRRVLIPKNSGKTRALGLPTWSDKLVGEVVRLLLEAYYEPTFSDRSHGFRPGRGCHTALREIANTWTGTAWFIEGHIADCLGSLDHDLMVTILSEKILDNRFLRLVRHMLTAGYLEDWKWGATLSGAFRGGVASPILSSIYLHQPDQFVETVVIPKYTRGGRRAGNPAYLDDHPLGFTDPEAEAEEIKQRLVEFLHDELKLELPRDKTLIIHARTGVTHKAESAPYLHRGQPAKQKALTGGGDHTIVATYGAVHRGIVQDYLLAGDVDRLHRLRRAMETSMLKALAGKHRSTVSTIAAKHNAKIQTPDGPRTCFQACIERDGRQPLVERFAEIPLHRQKPATVTDRQPVRVDYPHKELVSRLLADVCEICQQPGKVGVHRVRKLADLGQPGPLQPQWAKAMDIRRRTTLVVCASCHGHIHGGQPATPLTQ